MLIYYNLNPEEYDEFNVGFRTISISVILAVAHALLECPKLAFEARACKTAFTNYVVICINGRFGWTPFLDNMTEQASLLQKMQNNEDKMLFNYDMIAHTSQFMHVQVPFVFSDFGCSQLRKTVSELPQMSNEFTIQLGSCIENLAIEEFYQLILICGPKTDLRLKVKEQEFNAMIDKSIEYKRASKVIHTVDTVTVLSKLFNACIDDGQLELIVYLLKMTESLGVYFTEKNIIKMVKSQKNIEVKLLKELFDKVLRSYNVY